MGFFSTPTSSSASLSKKFKVTSQTQLKRVSKTYWNKQFSRKGIKMKGEDGELEYIKAPGVRDKVAQLLRKRGYVSETSLQKDLIKERVRQEDRKRVINAMRGKFAKKEDGAVLTPEQIQANVKKARAVDRLMSTKGQSAADNIKHGKDADRIKQEFKSDYSRLGVKGTHYNIGGKELSTDDPRGSANTSQEGKDAVASTSVNARGDIKGVASESKGLIDKKENSIAAEVGTKQSGKSEATEVRASSGSKNYSSLSLSPVKKLEKKKKEDAIVHSNLSQPADLEFLGGVLYNRRKAVQLSDLINEKKLTVGNEDKEKKSPTNIVEEEKEKKIIAYIGDDSIIYKKISNHCEDNKHFCQQIQSGVLNQVGSVKPDYIFLDANTPDSFQLYSQIKQLGILKIKKVIMLIARNEKEIREVIDKEIKYYQLKDELTNEKIAEIIK